MFEEELNFVKIVQQADIFLQTHQTMVHQKVKCSKLPYKHLHFVKHFAQ